MTVLYQLHMHQHINAKHICMPVLYMHIYVHKMSETSTIYAPPYCVQERERERERLGNYNTYINAVLGLF